MTKILIKRGQAEANLPTLDPGEPAVTFDSGGKLWIGTPSGNLEITGGGSGSPGGSDTQLQYNNGGAFGGAVAVTYDDTNDDFIILGSTNDSLFTTDYSANAVGIGTNGTAGSIALFGPSVIVLNEVGADRDFRIEGDTDSNLFFVDASTDRIGIGTNTPSTKFNVHESSAASPLIVTYSSGIATSGFTTAIERLVAQNSAAESVIYAQNQFWIDSATDGAEYGRYDLNLITNGSQITALRVNSTELILNDDGIDRDTRIEGDTATSLVVVDAGLDAFQVGTTVAGAIADFRSTAIVLNNAEADVDIRWGGNGVTNGVYFDAGNIRFGINTVPSVAFHVVEDSGTVAIFEENASGEVGINSFYNPNTTDNNGSLIRFDTDTTGTGATARSQIAQIGVVFTTHNHATRTGNIVFRNYQSGAFGTRMTIGAGIQVGSPTGGDKGAGTANFAGDIYKNNTAYTNPDYALEHWVVGEIKKFTNRGGAEGYYRLSIDESEKFVKENLHLPRISRDPVGIFGMADMALEKIEEAHIYIYELNYRIKRLEELLDLN